VDTQLPIAAAKPAMFRIVVIRRDLDECCRAGRMQRGHSNAAARIHCAFQRSGGDVAAGCACAEDKTLIAILGSGAADAGSSKRMMSMLAASLREVGLSQG
jgi:hypothetical protein